MMLILASPFFNYTLTILIGLISFSIEYYKANLLGLGDANNTPKGVQPSSNLFNRFVIVG